MKNLALAFSFFMFCFSIQAQKTYTSQDFTVTLGYPYEIPKGYVDLGFFGDIEKGFAQLSYKIRKDLCLQVFDNNMKVIRQNNIDITMFPSDFTNEGFYRLGNKYYWFFSTFSRSDEMESFWVQELDIAQGILTGPPRQFIRNNRLEGHLRTTGFYQYVLANKYMIKTSLDKSKLLITYTLKHKSKNDKINRKEIGFSVIDQDFNIITNKIIEMPLTEEKMDPEEFHVDGKGNAYLLAKVYEGINQKESKNNLPNYHFELFRIGAGNAELAQIKIKTGSYFISDLFLTEQTDGSVIVGGCYSKDDDGNSSDGIFLEKIDQNGNATNFGPGYFEFPIDVLKQFMTERQQKKLEKRDEKNDVEARNLILRKITTHDNGSMEIIGEVSYMLTHTYNNGRTYYTVNTYYYEDILVLNISAAGEIVWAKKIPKRQEGKNGRGSMGFGHFTYGNNSYLFYTDNPNNLDLIQNEVPSYHRDGAGGVLVYSKIDSNGTVTKGDLFDYKAEGIRFEPAEFQYLGNKTMISRAFKGRMSRVVLLNQK